jgi:hypothetical protein
VQVKVCTVCGDRGFTDLLVTCNQCNDLAEHVYVFWKLNMPECFLMSYKCSISGKFI